MCVCKAIFWLGNTAKFNWTKRYIYIKILLVRVHRSYWRLRVSSLLSVSHILDYDRTAAAQLRPIICWLQAALVSSSLETKVLSGLVKWNSCTPQLGQLTVWL